MDLIVKMKFGSHLYGTNTDSSDIDYKGVYLPTKNEMLLNDIPKCINYSTGSDKEKNNPGDVDEEIYSLHYFIKLAIDGQTAAMDMLHAPESMLIVNTEIWKDIVKNRDKFYTKNLSSFINYARRQASKYGIKGSRLNAVSQVISIFGKLDENIKLKDMWSTLPINDYCHDVGLNPNGIRQYQVCGKTFQETVSVGYVLPILRNFYDEYGHRARLAAENKNIDWKAISHALRAAIQTKEILVNGTITFPLKDASFLLSVKSGELDYSKDVAPVLETLMEEVEELIKQSNLPEKVDIDFWNNFICETLEKTRLK